MDIAKISSDLEQYRIFPMTVTVTVTEKATARTGHHYQMLFGVFHSVQFQKPNRDIVYLKNTEVAVRNALVERIGGLEANRALLQQHEYTFAAADKRPTAVLVFTPETAEALMEKLEQNGFVESESAEYNRAKEHKFTIVVDNEESLQQVLAF